MAKRKRRKRRRRAAPPQPAPPAAPVGFGEGIAEQPVQRGPGFTRVGGQTMRGPLPSAGAGAAAATGAIPGPKAVAAAEESIGSWMDTYTGKGWPTTSERVRRMFKKAGLIESLDEINSRVAGKAAKQFRGLAAGARAGNNAKTALGAVVEAVTGLQVKLGINGAIVEAMGLKGVLRGAARTAGLAAAGVGALAAFEAPDFATDLLASRRDVSAVDAAIASSRAGEPGALLPSVQDLVDEDKLQYLRQRNMARLLAASGASPSQLAGTMPLPAEGGSRVPTTLSVPGSAGFPG